MFYSLIWFSLVVASVSFTVTEAYIFKWLRDMAAKKSHFAGKLLSCGYCFSHYVAFFLVIAYDLRFFWSDCFVLDYFLSALALSWTGSLWWILMNILMNAAEK